MTRVLGGIRQNGYVVDDLDAAIEYWTGIVGVGPFFRVDHVPLEFFMYQGEPSAPDLNIALANCGDVQIELIQQVNDAPSPWRNFALAKGSGLHHVSGWTQTYEADVKRMVESGHLLSCEGSLAGGVRFAYFQATNVDGTAIEIADVSSAEFQQLCEHIRRSAIDWNGKDPVRDLFGAAEPLPGNGVSDHHSQAVNPTSGGSK